MKRQLRLPILSHTKRRSESHPKPPPSYDSVGRIAGLMFAQEMTSSDRPAIPYAAVMPLAQLTPILCAQALAVFAVH